MQRVPPAPPRLERRRAVERAWQSFVQDGIAPAGVREEICQSWQRARDAHRISPALRRAGNGLSADALVARRDADPILGIVAPILRDFAERLGPLGHVLAWFDGEGWMLAIDGDPHVVDRVQEIDFSPGANWAERSVGTNGPGTALAERRPIEVFASEHYVAAWHPWSCAAAPVFAPGEQAPVGVVDITGPWQVQRPHALLAAKAIARAVEERLRAAASVRDEVIRHAFRAARESGDVLVAVDCRGHVVAANDAASRQRVLVEGALPPALRAALAQTLGSRGTREEEVLLADSLGSPVTAAPIRHETTTVGALVRLRTPRGEGRARARGPGATSRYAFSQIVGSSDALGVALDLARTAARNRLPVVLCGESGTGKELFAQAIHGAGSRADGPFVAVNCGAIPAQIVEAELFGYEAGTFTGGRRDGKAGRFEDADGGTLFLDEVSELTAQAQTALLRVLQEREVVRLGGNTPRRVEVRVIAATNKPLDEELRAHRFRRDLFYRLNVLTIAVPPLARRGGDIAALAAVFLAEAEGELGRRGLLLGDDALEALRAHSWPGNVRELRNVILRAAATAPAERIAASDLQLPQPPADDRELPAGAESPTLRATVRATEHGALLEALEASGWNYARAASRLGISRMTLYRRLARCGISRRA